MTFESMFDYSKKAAAKAAAENLRSKGFSVLSSGFGNVVVKHLGRSLIIEAPKVDDFIKENTFASIEDFLSKNPIFTPIEVLIPENCAMVTAQNMTFHVVINNGVADMEKMQ